MMPMTTAAAAAELARYMAITPQDGGGDADHYRALVALMVDVPCRTQTDALALMSWVSTFLPIALADIPADDNDTGGPHALIAVAAKMAERAVLALETSTGIPAEAFIGQPKPAN